MALAWTWAFGAESAVVLQSMGWSFDNTGTFANEPRTTFQYTYSGSPTRYSMAMDPGVGFRLPTTVNAPSGWIGFAVYHETTPYALVYPIIEIRGAIFNREVRVDMLTSGALALYVDSIYKASTSVFTWLGQWHYVALRYDYTGADVAGAHSGQIFVDGVAATGIETDAATLEADTTTHFVGTASGDRTQHIAQIAAWDSLADPGEVARFVTRLDVDADVSEVGTWTPSAGATNFGVVGGTFDAATYTEEATPSASDDVIVNLSADLATKLGISPSAIDGITAHTFSTGLGQTARAEVGDQVGTVTTAGATGAISSTTTERHATAATKPSGGAWAGTDTPKGKYFVVTV